jgi:cysteine desulfurase
MLPFFDCVYGNPASGDHAFGWDAQEAVEGARALVAELIGDT